MKTRIICVISGMLLLASAAFGQGYRYDNVALLDTGRPANSASILVCSSGSTGTPCTPTAAIFSNAALTVPITQPGFTSDALGNYGFYANCNKYDVQISGSGLTTRTMKDVQIGPCNSASSVSENGQFLSNGTCSAPAFAYASETNSGWFWQQAGIQGLCRQGNYVMQLTAGRFSIASGFALSFSSGAPNAVTADAGISRGGVATIDVGNGTAGDASGTLNASNIGVKQDISGCFMVGGLLGTANIQAAITLAGTTGCVDVPNSYAGTDTYTNANGIPVFDHRGNSFVFGGNSIYITNLLRTAPSLDGSARLIPLGNDLNLSVSGAADRIDQVLRFNTTSTTTVGGAGTQNITVGATGSLYLGAAIQIDRWGANAELINTGSWSIVNGTTINATFTKAHTQPYQVDQWGIHFFNGWQWRFSDSDTSTILFQFTQLRNGVNKGFALQDANNLPLYSNDPFDFVPRLFGHSGLFLFGNNGGTGTSGSVSIRNNPVDNTTLFFVDTSGNATATGSLTANTDVTFRRPLATKGTALTTPKIVPNAGMGTTATVASVRGTDAAFAVQVTSNGTGQAVNGGFTVTFADGTWTTVPICTLARTEGTSPSGSWFIPSSLATATTIVVDLNAVPVAGTTYGVNVICAGSPN